MSEGAGQCHCEDGLQKVADVVVGGLPVAGKKKMSHLASVRGMWGNYRLVSLTLAFKEDCGAGPTDSHVLALKSQEDDWE